MARSAIGNYIFLTAEAYTGKRPNSRTPKYDSFHYIMEEKHEQILNDLNERNDIDLARKLEKHYNKAYFILKGEQKPDETFKDLSSRDFINYVNKKIADNFGRGKFSIESEQWIYDSQQKFQKINKETSEIYQYGLKGLEASIQEAKEAAEEMKQALNPEIASNLLIKRIDRSIKKFNKAIDILKSLSNDARFIKNQYIGDFNRQNVIGKSKKKIENFKKALQANEKGAEAIKLYNEACGAIFTNIKNNIQGMVGEYFAEYVANVGEAEAIQVGLETVTRAIRKNNFVRSITDPSSKVPAVQELNAKVFNIKKARKTQQKTDITLTMNINDEPHIGNLSVKSTEFTMNKKGMIGAHSIKILQGSNFLYMIQNENDNNFINQWINITQQFHPHEKYGERDTNYAFENMRQLAHTTMQDLLLWKGLTGANLLGTKSGQDANLFMIMDSSGKYGVKVLTMKELYLMCVNYRGPRGGKYYSITGYQKAFMKGSNNVPWGRPIEKEELKTVYPEKTGRTRIAKMIMIMSRTKISISLKAFKMNHFT